MAKPEEGKYYKIHVKHLEGRKHEADIRKAVYIGGTWWKRHYYDRMDSDEAVVDIHGQIGYEYVPIDKSFEVTSWELMEDQRDERQDDAD